GPLGRRRLDIDLDQLADAQLAHVLEAEPGQRALHRGALHVEDAGLEPDEDADLHARPARRKIVSTWRTYQVGSKQAFSSAGGRRSVTAGSAASSSRSGRRSLQARMA